MQTIGRLFLQTRRQSRLSQKALAAKLGIETSYISKIENGKVSSVGDDLLHRFSIISGLGIDELNFACGRMPTWMWDCIMGDPVLFRDLCKCDRDSLRKFLENGNGDFRD